MLEHFSALRRKNSEVSQNPSSSERINSLLADDDQKDVSDVESFSSKTKSLFKDLISDNGATNILQNCTNFIKCTSSMSNSNPSTSSYTCAAPNGSCREQQQKLDNQDAAQDTSQKSEVKVISNLNKNNGVESNPPTIAVNAQVKEYSPRKRSFAPNGDVSLMRELSPSPRPYRKSSYDSRMLKSTDEDANKHSNMRPLKTRNIITKNETYDTLHCKAMNVSIEIELSLFSLFEFESVGFIK